MSGEQHRPIPSAPGYVATADGRILSRSGWRGLVTRELRQSWSGRKRYAVVRPVVDGRRVTRRVHVLVAEAFHGERPSGLLVRHRNGDRRDNRAENLAFGTALDNAADRARHGTVARGERVATSKLSEDNVREIRRRLEQGERRPALAVEFGVTSNTIARIERAETWRHVIAA